jgi:alpha-glucosidase (family GH31 glycosyl hydrolase)
MVENVIA